MRTALDGVLHDGRGELLVAESAGLYAAVHGRATYLAGDPNAGTAAEELLERVGHPFRFMYDCAAWKGVLLRHFGQKAEVLEREAFDSSSLDRRRLAMLRNSLPEEFQIVKIDAEIAYRLNTELYPYCIFGGSFSSSIDFFAHGFGFCALQGARIVSAATTADVFRKLVEVEINTLTEFRQQGLGTATSAEFLLYCLDNRWLPNWDAKNDVSAHLAKKLGFKHLAKYEVVSLRRTE